MRMSNINDALSNEWGNEKKQKLLQLYSVYLTTSIHGILSLQPEDGVLESLYHSDTKSTKAFYNET